MLPDLTLSKSLELKMQNLFTALQKAGFDLTGLELAEIIWLAVQMGETEAQEISTTTQFQKEESSSTEKTSPETSPAEAKKEKTAEVYPYHSTSSSSTENIIEIPIKVPAAPALRNTLGLARAIRPLMRKIPSYTEQVLNETATVKRIVDENIWFPVLQPAPQKWLELGLVIEQSDSTVIWKQTIRELQELLGYYGAFRDVRVWRLEMNGTKARLFPNINKNQQQRPRNPKEIIDPRGQRLILLVSDCVSSVWRDGSIYPLMRLWGSQGLLTILQLFPERLWDRTALNQDIPVQLRALTPGAFNSQLKAEVQLEDELEEEELIDMIKVPVITLEPRPLANWSRVIAGFSSNTTAGFIFSPSLVDSELSTSELPEESITPERRVSHFRGTASKLARRLAGLIAGTSVSFPVVNLIQQTMLPESNQVHVAEIFMSGLLKRVSSEKIEADYIEYEFYDGVRELLLQSVPKSETLLVKEKVSEFLAQRLGLSLREFKAFLAWSSDSQLRSFARLNPQQLEENRSLLTDLENLEELLSQRKWQEIESLIPYEPVLLVQKLANFLYPLETKHPDRYVRETAVGALGKIIEANVTQKILLQTVEPIIQILRKDEISQVRDAAKESLAKIYHKVQDQLNLPSPPPEVIQVDRTWRRENDLEVSRFYGEILYKRLQEIDADRVEVVELFTNFLGESNDIDVRTAATRELGELGSPTADEAVPELIKAIDFKNKNSDRYLRQEAAITLGRLTPTTDIVDALNKAYRQDVIKQVREAAFQGLEKIANLDNLRGKRAQRYLKLMHPDRLQKFEIDIENSIETLKRLSNESSLSDEVVDQLIEAAEVLGTCQNRELIDDANNTLIKVLENENPNIVAAAADALGKIGNLQARKSLLSKLKKIERGDWIAREYIIRALGNLQSKLSKENKDIDPTPVINALIERWGNDAISSVREEIEPALRKIYQITRHPIAYQALKRYPNYNKQTVESFYKKFFEDFPINKEEQTDDSSHLIFNLKYLSPAAIKLPANTLAESKPWEKLTSWLEGIFSEAWQPVEEVLANRKPIMQMAFTVDKTTEKLSPKVFEKIIKQFQISQKLREKIQTYLSQPELSDIEVNEALVQILQTTEDEETRWEIAELLWKIDPNHPAAGVRRAIDLGMELAAIPVALMIAILPKPNQRFAVLSRVYPLQDQRFLPANLKLIGLDEKEKSLFEIPAGQIDDYIQYKFTADADDRFSLQVSLNSAIVTKDFII